MSRSVRVTSTGDVTTERANLQSVHITTSGAGRLTLNDGGSGGDTKFDVDTTGAETLSFYLSDEGVHFAKGIHVATATALTAVTLVFR